MLYKSITYITKGAGVQGSKNSSMAIAGIPATVPSRYPLSYL